MIENSLPFEFTNAPAVSPTDGLLARVPRGVRSKQKLFAILAERLHLPGYFGRNWDALEECLQTLDVNVVLLHDDLPFGAGGENRAVYLAILQDWKQRRPDHVRIVFPAELENDVRQSLAVS